MVMKQKGLAFLMPMTWKVSGTFTVCECLITRLTLHHLEKNYRENIVKMIIFKLTILVLWIKKLWQRRNYHQTPFLFINITNSYNNGIGTAAASSLLLRCSERRGWRPPRPQIWSDGLKSLRGKTGIYYQTIWNRWIMFAGAVDVILAARSSGSASYNNDKQRWRYSSASAL